MLVTCCLLCFSLAKIHLPRLKLGAKHHDTDVKDENSADLGYPAKIAKGGVSNGGLGGLDRPEGGITEHPPHPDKSVKYLWTQAPAFMGFGDKVRWHYVQRNIAAVLNRTWIVPPFHFTQSVPKKIKDKQTTALVNGAVQAGELEKAQQELEKAYAPGYTPDRFYAVSEWFDKQQISNLGPVIEHAEWYASTTVPGAGGHVDVVVVPGEEWHVQREEDKDWPTMCL